MKSEESESLNKTSIKAIDSDNLDNLQPGLDIQNKNQKKKSQLNYGDSKFENPKTFSYKDKNQNISMDKNLNSMKRNSNTYDINKFNNFGNSSYDEENHNNLNGNNNL